MKTKGIFLLAILAVPLVGCATPQPEMTAAPPPLTLPTGYAAEILASDLRGPTQMIVGPEGALWVAQLNGDENAGAGQVIAISIQTGEKRVLLDGLLKPTGLAIADGALWIASGRDLLRAPISGAGVAEPPETLLNDLPFNGRSNGTLTVSPTGNIIFETSGNRIGNKAEAGSAQLWELDPQTPSQPRSLATGLKNAYGHVFDAASRLWATEVADDPVNGEEPPDELNLIVEGGNFGWPGCFGDRQAAINYGGTDSACQTTRPAVVAFPPQSTPTGVAVSPWEADTLLVALWGPTDPAVVRVQLELNGAEAAGIVSPFITGLTHPQHLLVLADDSLLVSDHETGMIYRITHTP
jgi:glucose/arabinose dehydrogenase